MAKLISVELEDWQVFGLQEAARDNREHSQDYVKRVVLGAVYADLVSVHETSKTISQLNDEEIEEYRKRAIESLVKHS